VNDTDLIEWLNSHPYLSSYSEPGGIVLTSYASIGRGVDWRAALVALVADSERAARAGLPCARERAEMASKAERGAS
jgi:hypothetical protein